MSYKILLAIIIVFASRCSAMHEEKEILTRVILPAFTAGFVLYQSETGTAAKKPSAQRRTLENRKHQSYYGISTAQAHEWWLSQ